MSRWEFVDGERLCYVKVCSPADMCSSLPIGLETSILSVRSVSNKACPLIKTTKCFTLPFYSIEVWISPSNWESYGSVFCCGQ